MKEAAISIVAVAALIGAPAFAADMAVKAPPPAPAPVYDWTGWYAGLNGGGDWGRSRAPMTVSGAFPVFTAGFDATASQGFNTSGLTGGVQGGYNWQAGNVLLGVEADFEYFRSGGFQSISFPTPNGPGLTSNITKSTNTDWLLTARPRLGIVSNTWLFYGTGGLALTRLKAAWYYLDNLAGGALADASSATASTTKAGWTAGGGIEAALPGNWRVGGEYLYVRFTSVSATDNFTIGGNVAPTIPVTNRADLAANIIRARLSKRF
jgi:outer membrane immunogenic protein